MGRSSEIDATFSVFRNQGGGDRLSDPPVELAHAPALDDDHLRWFSSSSIPPGCDPVMSFILKDDFDFVTSSATVSLLVNGRGECSSGAGELDPHASFVLIRAEHPSIEQPIDPRY